MWTACRNRISGLHQGISTHVLDFAYRRLSREYRENSMREEHIYDYLIERHFKESHLKNYVRNSHRNIREVRLMGSACVSAETPFAGKWSYSIKTVLINSNECHLPDVLR